MKAFLFTCAAVIVGFLIFFAVFGNHISDHVRAAIWFSPLYGAFFAITFLCLLFATPKRRARWERITLWVIGLLFLLLQGGCWGAAAAFGRATGGGGDDTWWHNVMAIAAGVFMLWSLVILFIATKK